MKYKLKPMTTPMLKQEVGTLCFFPNCFLNLTVPLCNTHLPADIFSKDTGFSVSFTHLLDVGYWYIIVGYVLKVEKATKHFGHLLCNCFLNSWKQNNLWVKFENFWSRIFCQMLVRQYQFAQFKFAN